MKEIKETITSVTYETFFSPIKHKGVSENRLVLIAPPLSRDLITKKYIDILLSVLQKASDGKLIDVIWEE